MAFNIGDRVIDFRTSHKATVTDRLYSEAKSQNLYEITYDGAKAPCMQWLKEEDLERVPEITKSYRFDVQLLENVVLAVVYEQEGDKDTEIARGHGHIMHKNEVGVLQAASYAMKKAYFSVMDEEEVR